MFTVAAHIQAEPTGDGFSWEMVKLWSKSELCQSAVECASRATLVQ